VAEKWYEMIQGDAALWVGNFHQLVLVSVVIISAIQILLMLTQHIKCVTVDIYRQRDTVLVYQMTVGRRNWSLLCRHW